MTRTVFTVAAAVAAVAVAEPEQCQEEVWAGVCNDMRTWSVDWEVIQVHTDDGYTMQTIHLLGGPDGPYEITKNAMLWQHGMGGSAESYLWMLGNKKPMVVSFAERGFDVYMANNSGTKFSQQHDVYTIKDAEFWAKDWSGMGLYDLPANVKMI